MKEIIKFIKQNIFQTQEVHIQFTLHLHVIYIACNIKLVYGVYGRYIEWVYFWLIDDEHMRFLWF